MRNFFKKHIYYIKNLSFILFVGLLFIWGIYGMVISNYSTLTDDGGIGFRYAERFSEGKGFSYNDNEYINGASGPLYVLVLSGVNYFTKDLQSSAAIVGIFLLIVTIISISIIFLKEKNLIGFVIFILLFSTNYFVLIQYFDGLESGLTCTLISLLAVFLYIKNFKWIGIILGVLLANKLDAGVAAIAVTIVFLFSQKKIPIKTAIWALIAVAPMFLLLIFYFGSFLPQSMISKMAGPAHEIVKEFNHLWMFGLIYHLSLGRVVLLIISLLALFIKHRFIDCVLLIYFILHLGVYSLINLGDKYPWYAVPASYLMIIISALYLGNIIEFLHQYSKKNVFKESFLQKFSKINYKNSINIIIIIAILITTWNFQRYNWNSELAPYEKGNLSRSAAGAWLKKVAKPQEVLYTGWGLPAFEYKGPTYDPAGLTSPFNKKPNPDYVVMEFLPDNTPPKELQAVNLFKTTEDKKFHLLASFNISNAPQFYSIYGGENSVGFEKVKNVKNKNMQVSAMTFTSNGDNLFGNQVMQIQANDLFAHAPFDMSTEIDWDENAILNFIPELAINAHDSDGVTFIIEMNNQIVYEEDVYIGQNIDEVHLLLKNNGEGKTKITFKTLPHENHISDWAWYKKINIKYQDIEYLTANDFSYLNERQERELVKNILPQYH